MEENSKQLAHAFLQGDIHGSWMIIQEHVNAGMNSYYIYEQLLTKAMQYIGTLWEENDITVADEHIATGVCDFVLSRYAFPKVQSHQEHRRAMFFCLEGEEHYLGLKMVHSLFKEEGWNCRYLGPNLPLEYALYTIQNFKPDVVGMSLSLSTQLPQLKIYLDAFDQLTEQPEILIGSRLGSTINTNFLSMYKNIQFVNSLQDVRLWFEDDALQISQL
ncbi:cobalamin B12-binding domain-containing protein [Halalkalibacter akibai]|uniref:B12-binding domain-containing protein n=1 Tax=Halalkalibacter akibai (strain ATCC 43226 / DSM 21942 / CIP 109018 / JCM 9157 / 1139) TaxID=1236973 RepID=W4QZ43_HALA3|nr:cobalamin-dependent protein [Halalkalibacter akibai]GAE37351.1 hypothetical protein JCM9157_4625 [Halalkalibacter akibai JCM 9157]